MGGFLDKIQQVSHRFAVIASWQVSKSIGQHRVSSPRGLATTVED
jgi:hypothetical protein